MVLNKILKITRKATKPDFMSLSVFSVPSDDFFVPNLTVRETLRFSQLLVKQERNPELDAEVLHLQSSAFYILIPTLLRVMKELGDLLIKLGLDKVKNTLVGDPHKRGVSTGQKPHYHHKHGAVGILSCGEMQFSAQLPDESWYLGEARRLSIGMGLLMKPALIFLDEPTSGLDSRTFACLALDLLHCFSHRRLTLYALCRSRFERDEDVAFAGEKGRLRICYILDSKAFLCCCMQGHTVVCSVHQPRSNIFRLFDQLLILQQVLLHLRFMCYF